MIAPRTGWGDPTRFQYSSIEGNTLLSIHRRNIVFALFLGIGIHFVYGDIELGKDLTLDTKFYFDIDQDRIFEDYFALGCDTALTYEVKDDWDFQIGVDIGTDAIRLEEVWGKYDFGSWNIKVGLFDSWLLLDDILTSKQNIVGESNPIRERLADMGWYTSGAVGARYYRKYKGKDEPISGQVHLYFQPSAREVQIDGAFLWAFAGEDTYVGVTASYYPYWYHEYRLHTYTHDNNFLFNIVAADYSKRRGLMYKFETTLANNLVDPIGYVH